MQVRRGRLLALVTAAIGMDVLVYSMLIPLLPSYAQAYGLSQIDLGLLLAVYAAGLFLATPLSGRLCDRYGYRLPFLAGQAGLVAAILLFALSDSYLTLLLARFLQGAASGATWTAGLALVAEHYPARERGKAMGTALSGNGAGLLLGPLFGGAAADRLGLALPFYLAAGLASVLLLLAWLLRQQLRAVGGPTLQADLGLLRQPPVRALALALLAITTVFTLIEPTLPLHLAAQFDAGAGRIGLLFAIIMLGHALCTPLAGLASDRYGSAATIRAGGLVVALTLPTLVLPTSLLGQTLCLLVFGMATAFALIPTLPLLASLVERYRGGGHALAFALFNVLFAGGMMLGPGLGSVLAQWVGLFATLFVAAAVLLLLLWRLPKV